MAMIRFARGRARAWLAGALGIVIAMSLAASASGQTVVIDADAAADDQDISTFFPGVVLSSVGGGDGKVYAEQHNFPITAPHSFAWKNGIFFDEHWGRRDAPTFRAEFACSASFVSIQQSSDGSVTMEAFDGGGGSLGTISGANPLQINAAGIRRVEVSITNASDEGTLDDLRYECVPAPARSGCSGP